MMKSILFSAILLLAPAAHADAQDVAVEVRLGPAVQARLHDLGREAVEAERQVLMSDLQRAVAQGQVRRVVLTIEDIQPNRPTAAQLGRSPSLNAASVGLGGAAVTGEVVRADGAVQPVRFRDFPQDLRFETDFSTWGDADRAFDTLARRIASGDTPADKGAWPPPHKAVAPTGTLLPG